MICLRVRSAYHQFLQKRQNSVIFYSAALAERDVRADILDRNIAAESKLAVARQVESLSGFDLNVFCGPGEAYLTYTNDDIHDLCVACPKFVVTGQEKSESLAVAVCCVDGVADDFPVKIYIRLGNSCYIFELFYHLVTTS